MCIFFCYTNAKHVKFDEHFSKNKNGSSTACWWSRCCRQGSFSQGLAGLYGTWVVHEKSNNFYSFLTLGQVIRSFYSGCLVGSSSNIVSPFPCLDAKVNKINEGNTKLRHRKYINHFLTSFMLPQLKQDFSFIHSISSPNVTSFI